MAQEKHSNIRKYHKPLNVNIGMIIFGAMFIYIIICIIMYMQTEHLSGYEVKTGSLTVNNVYRGIALREETLYESIDAGYVYYFAPEGTHVACGDLVYAVDSSSKLAELMNESTEEENLTNADYNSLKAKIVNYRSNFDETEFSTVYDFKYDLQSEIAKLSNRAVLSAMNEMAGATGISRCYADKAGAVVFSSDGYENLTPQEITLESFNEENYTKNQFLTANRFGKNDPVYKLVSKEDWEVVIQVDTEERVQELMEAEYVKVKFMKDQYEVWGKVTVYGHDEKEGITFVGLSFTTSMINYITDRFVDVELVLEEDTGLKIPNSSIAQRNFFLIDEDYIVEQGSDKKTGVMRQTFTEDNEITSEFVETPIYNIDEEEGLYYVDESVLNVGDVLYKEDSSETLTVSKQASLTGVYNINKGYADFKRIIVLYDNEEYSIVESNTQYGLRPYDYIALEASTVVADQFVTEKKLNVNTEE
ncbi:MAG: hypothetical protein HFI11_08330 [Lachnospiraceae bacterium]|nr:hypothetical protein [Lachnospiraceae bacterium]